MNSGFTLAEISIAAVAATIVFGSAVTLAAGINNVINRRLRLSAVSAEAHKLAGHVSRDVRAARSVHQESENWVLVRPTPGSVTYRSRNGELYRNDMAIQSGVAVLQFSITANYGETDERLVIIRLQIADVVDSTITVSRTTAARLRGAVEWPITTY